MGIQEFIAWDENMEDFMSFEEVEQQWESEGYHRAILSQDHYSVHNYIGKTDIEGNKIFEDSSIVEFDVVYERGISGDFKTGGGFQKSFKAKGYFTYCSEIASYYIDDVKNKSRLYLFEHDIEDIKIIGTLQQNKELLDERD